MAILEVNNLTKTFGGLSAVADLDFALAEGEILGLIGPNGAGKTTVFNLINGFFPATKGRIILRDKDITRCSAHRIAALGLGRTFQLPTMFGEMTALDNVLLGLHLRMGGGFWRGLLQTSPIVRIGKRRAQDQAAELMDFMGVSPYANTLAKNLPYFHQKALGCAVALAGEPTVLLLDEPMSGLSAEETREMMTHVRRMRDRGISVLLIEHKMKAVMGVCERIVVLEFGRKIAEGSPGEIQGNQKVIEAYLGTTHVA